MKTKKTVLRQVVNIIAFSLLVISFKNVGIYFDDFNLSVYDVIIISISYMGLLKLNDFFSQKENHNGD